MEDRDKKEGNRAAGFAFSVTEVIGYSSSTNKPYSMLLERSTERRNAILVYYRQKFHPEPRITWPHQRSFTISISATTKPFYFSVVLYLFYLSVCISN
jgi:hypothetical protein